MGFLEDLIRERRERRERIAAAAYKPPKPPEKPPEEDIRTIGSDFDIIMREVCKHYNVDKDRILSDTRLMNVARPRQMLIFMLYRMTKMTTWQMGHRLLRDPSTVAYAIKKMEAEVARHEADIAKLEEKINSILSRRKAILEEKSNPEGKEQSK